jgi:alpha-tubulin suppressor-like RCC1 family protein
MKITSTGVEQWFVVGDAHHDKVSALQGCHQFAGVGGHITSEYVQARENLATAWPAKSSLTKWGNTFEIEQCNHEHIGNTDGNVRYLTATVASKSSGIEPENTTEPKISGSGAPGAALTVSNGTWENPAATAFTYQWCYIELESDECHAIPGAATNSWTPQTSDEGKVVAALVQPAGAEATDAVLSSAIEVRTPAASPPTATTEGASAIGPHAATVEATVNPNGANTFYYFEYGTTSGTFESSAPGAWAGAGSSPVHVTARLSELAPYTKYYYRVVATNSKGTSYGAQREFATTAMGTLSVGSKVSCALVSSGAVYCWGENYFDEMGNGSSQKQFTTPVAVPGITNAIEIAAGGAHVCALLADGSSKCWGDNQFGELGIGYTSKDSTPVQVSGIANAIAITAGDADTCALLSGGTIDCWGANIYGELGNGTTTNSSTPVPVSGITNAIAVTAGYASTCATLSSGGVDCWGYNGYGELGNGTTTNSSTPVSVSGITTASAAAVPAVGAFHACAPLSSGGVDCWGYNEQGQLGNGTTSRDRLTPVAVGGITNATTVAAGYFHTCASLSTGGARCWGENPFGELGNGTTTNSSTPVAVSGITTATGVAGGEAHSCTRLIGGGVDCWGDNIDGQLGNGTTTSSLTPVTVTGLP